MTNHTQLRLVAFLVAVAPWVFAPVTAFANGPVSSMDDIQFWSGEGANRSALAIDWAGQDEFSQSLVWGYRWDTAQTAADMLLEVVASDSRLYAKVGDFGNLGLALYGIGYDASGDGQFELSDGTQFDADGIATSGPADLATAVDAGDFYQEGWLLGYWHQGVTTTNPANWVSGPGLANRDLADGSWDSLAFTHSVFDNQSFASHLLAAQTNSIPGDYNRNGVVDAADFTIWHDSLGAAVIAAGYGADGDFDQQITSADFDVWVDAFSGGGSVSIPEPRRAIWVCCLLLSRLFLFKTRNRD